jgi:hypothetical protein
MAGRNGPARGRRAYEAYCARNKLDPASDKANYGYLLVELTTTEKKAIPAVKNANGLNGKVRAFELAFERAGIKHYDSRYKYAERALAAFRKAPVASPAHPRGPMPESPAILPPEPRPPPPDIEPQAPAQKPAPPAGFFMRALTALIRFILERR